MDHMPNKMWLEINYPFPNFNGATLAIWERINNFIAQFIFYHQTINYNLYKHPYNVDNFCFLTQLTRDPMTFSITNINVKAIIREVFAVKTVPVSPILL